MQHDHLKFYNHSQKPAGAANETNKTAFAYTMGGTGVVPGLIAPPVASKSTAAGNRGSDGRRQAEGSNAGAESKGNCDAEAGDADAGGNENDEAAAARAEAALRHKVNLQKQFEIIEYIKSVQGDSRVTYYDIKKDLNIDLEHDIYLLSMLKSNPRIDQERTSDGKMSFRYRTKYNIRNKTQLLDAIARARTGLIMTDIVQDVIDFYPTVEAECNSLIVGGEIIAHHNRVSHSLILYPRGPKFLTRLSGIVTATPGDQLVKTSASLTDEVRRGEAIKVGNHWYRVSSAVGTGNASDQTSTAKAPPTVTLDKDLPSKNVYAIPYTAESMPLDGDFQGAQKTDENGNEFVDGYVGPAYRHGVTTDIKECWKKTAAGVRAFKGDEVALRQELVHLGLVSQSFSRKENTANKRQKTGPKRKAARRRPSHYHEGTFGVNAHIWGTDLEKVLKETAAKNIAEEQGLS